MLADIDTVVTLCPVESQWSEQPAAAFAARWFAYLSPSAVAAAACARELPHLLTEVSGSVFVLILAIRISSCASQLRERRAATMICDAPLSTQHACKR